MDSAARGISFYFISNESVKDRGMLVHLSGGKVL